MVFYALIYNIGSFYSDLRISLIISGCIELPFVFIPIVLIDRLGRQFLTWFFLTMAGVCVLCMIPLLGTGQF